jgi:hypothetical protein
MKDTTRFHLYTVMLWRMNDVLQKHWLLVSNPSLVGIVEKLHHDKRVVAIRRRFSWSLNDSGLIERRCLGVYTIDNVSLSQIVDLACKDYLVFWQLEHWNE